MKLLRGLGIATMLLLIGQHVNAEEVNLQTTSVLNHNGLSYIPTKMVTEQLKAPVTWNNQDKTLTIKKADATISFKTGESTAKINGKVVATTPIVVKEGVSYLPLRFIAEALHMNVQWNAGVITLTTYDKYTVKKGDYLYKISQEFGVPVSEIQKINNLKDDKIQIGQILYLKPALGASNDGKSNGAGTGDASKANETKTSDTTINDGTTNKASKTNDSKTNGTSKSTIIYDDMLDDVIVNPPATTLPNEEKESSGKNNVENTAGTQNTKSASFEYATYVVKKGDYLSKISADYKVSLKDLLAANDLTETSILQIGDELLLPKRVIPIQSTVREQFGEYLDWWEEAQYVFPIGEIATVTDFETGVSFQVRRSYGTNHADCEPLTADDTEKAKEVWGEFSWDTRAVLVHVGERTVAASMSFMPHDIESILDNDFDGHFDIHFKNSTRHKDGKIDNYHQEKIKIAAGL